MVLNAMEKNTSEDGNALIGRLMRLGMADDASQPLNAVRLALDRAGPSWRQLAEEGRQYLSAPRSDRSATTAGPGKSRFISTTRHAGKRREMEQQIEPRRG
jgi:hypothetical protein